MNTYHQPFIYWIYFRNNEMMWLVETFPQGPIYLAYSTPWLLMTWYHKESGHQQPWYRPSYPWIFQFQHQKGGQLLNPFFILNNKVSHSETVISKNCFFGLHVDIIWKMPFMPQWDVSKKNCPYQKCQNIKDTIGSFQHKDCYWFYIIL